MCATLPKPSSACLLAELDEETPPAGFTVLHRNAQEHSLMPTAGYGPMSSVPHLGCVCPLRRLRRRGSHPVQGAVAAVDWVCLGARAVRARTFCLRVRHILEPDMPDLAGYLADNLPDGLAGGPR